MWEEEAHQENVILLKFYLILLNPLLIASGLRGSSTLSKNHCLIQASATHWEKLMVMLWFLAPCPMVASGEPPA